MIARIQPFLLPVATFVLALALSIVPLGDRMAGRSGRTGSPWC